jgi:hypothetical protein
MVCRLIIRTNRKESFMPKIRIQEIEKRVAAIREEIAEMGDIRPGSTTKQKRSARGKAYAEYWYVSYTFRGKGYTEYVPERAVETVQKENENFKRLGSLFDEWTELAIELSKLRIKAVREE